MLLNENGSLLIKNIIRKDRGQYKCEINYGNVFGQTILFKTLTELKVLNEKNDWAVLNAVSLQFSTTPPRLEYTSSISSISNEIVEIGSNVPHSMATSIMAKEFGKEVESNHSEILNGPTQLAPRIVKMTIHVQKHSNESKLENFENDTNAAKTVLIVVFSVLLVVAIVSIIVILIRIAYFGGTSKVAENSF